MDLILEESDIFDGIKLEGISHINLFKGENGIGKTALLKCLANELISDYHHLNFFELEEKSTQAALYYKDCDQQQKDAIIKFCKTAINSTIRDIKVHLYKGPLVTCEFVHIYYEGSDDGEEISKKRILKVFFNLICIALRNKRKPLIIDGIDLGMGSDIREKFCRELFPILKEFDIQLFASIYNTEFYLKAIEARDSMNENLKELEEKLTLSYYELFLTPEKKRIIHKLNSK